MGPICKVHECIAYSDDYEPSPYADSSRNLNEKEKGMCTWPIRVAPLTVGPT